MSKSASSSFSTYSNMSTPRDSPWNTPAYGRSPYDTPFDSPVSTPGNSPLLKAQSDEKPLPNARDIKMILSDVDGTLFDDNHNIHPRTKEAILHIRRTRPDIPIIPTTGKQYPSCAGLIEELDLTSFPAACLHGAIIYDKDGNIQLHSPLDPEFVLGVTNLMKQHNKTTMLYVADWVAMASLEMDSKSGTDWEAVSRGFDPTITDQRETNFLDLVMSGEEQIGKIFLPMDEDCVPEFLDLLRTTFPHKAFKVTMALPYVIEIVAENVGKHMALQYFCKLYNIAPENVLTMGDGENDAQMLKDAGYGLSMGNAMEAPRLAADYSTGTNNEGGVGMFLDRVFRPSRSEALKSEHLKGIDLRFTPIEPLDGIVAL